MHHLTVLGIEAACVGGSMDWQAQAAVYSRMQEQGSPLKARAGWQGGWVGWPSAAARCTAFSTASVWPS